MSPALSQTGVTSGVENLSELLASLSGVACGIIGDMICHIVEPPTETS